MDSLAYDLKRLTLGTGEGSHLTRNQRHRGLQLVARELKGLGYQLPGAGSLKPKHIHALVTKWQVDGLSAGTLKNRMGWVRWWAGKVRKTSVIPGDNTDLGIEKRTAFKGNRAHTTTGAALARLDERMQLIARLQMAFGLRLEESLKFRPEIAMQGDRLDLHASWCKGGRARSVPITIERQRELLDEVGSVAGTGSLIPEGVSYIAYRKQVERATWAAGIRNLHGHRHWYAQWRFRILTGRQPPASGGATYENLSRADRAADYRARLQISRELGHERVQITDTYLGRRFTGKGSAR